jgi:hypothetical protein
MERKISRMNMSPISKGILVNVGENIQDAIDACDKEGGGTVTLVAGTHIIDYNINVKSNISLVGEGLDVTIIDFEDGSFALQAVGTASDILKNIQIKDLTVQNSGATAGLTMQFSDYWNIENVRVHSCNTSGFRVFDCQYWSLNRCRGSSNGSSGFFITTTNGRTNIRFRLSSCNADSNSNHGYNISTGSNDMFWGNFIGCIANSNTVNGFDFSTTSSSALHSSLVGCIASNNVKGFVTASGVERLRFVNCVADTGSGDGFEIAGAGNSLIGCISDDGFDIQTAINFIGNDDTQASSDPKLQYSIAEKQIQSYMNLNENTRTIRKSVIMKNTSGGSLAAGDTVVLKAVASGDEITTTTTGGDTKVFGMVDETISDNAWGVILVEGYTTKLKVDGTTDIAIGDYLTTFTTAKIAAKASAGQICHAIALEAYTKDDSSGVIDALLIKKVQI